jgi:HD-like signal output (HDOD) protein
MTQPTQSSGQDCGLIVQQDGKPQQVLAKFLNLMLNYQCGLSIRVAEELQRGTAILMEESKSVRCIFVIQSYEITKISVLEDLGKNGELPLFLVLPQQRLELQKQIAAKCENTYFCAWENAFSDSENSLQKIAGAALEKNGVGNIFQDIDKVPYPVLQQRVERRLRNLNTLPTLPEIIMRIMRLVNDPETTTEQLEKLLCRDPAIVMKLLQVVKSPVFAGIARTSNWSLTDVIVRLGLKKVGAIAQQIKMINSLVKPGESEFDLRRFWEHSVGCAVIADKLYTKKMIALSGEVEFNDYWIGSLLHDVGKLVLGFFFWDWFARVVEQCERNNLAFRSVEAKMGDVASHERVGQLLIINANMGETLAGAVGNHHAPGEDPSALLCLIHMADNLCKELGLGYLAGDKGRYDAQVLAQIKLKRDDVVALRNTLAEDVKDEVKSLVDLCL